MHRKYLRSLQRAVLLPIWLLVATSPSSAQDDATLATARQLGVEGIDAYQGNDFQTAAQKLERAYQLVATPTLGLWSARAQIQTGHWVEGAERLRETLRSSPELGDVAAQRQALQDAAAELAALTPRLPLLTIGIADVQSTSLVLQLDGEALPSGIIGLPRPTNPGKHQLIVTRGMEQIDLSFELSEAEHKQLTLQFPAASAITVPEPALSPAAGGVQDTTRNSAWKPVTITALSLGGVGLATSAIAAFVAKGKRDGCMETDGRWLCETRGQASEYNSMRTVSTVSFYVGAGLAMSGLALWLLEPDPSKRSSDLAWSVGPGSVSVHGAF
jgi:hypothetical protein